MNKNYLSKERMLAALNFEKPDKVPVFLNNALATSRATGVRIKDMVTNPEKFSEALCTCYEKYGYDGIRISCDVAVEGEAMGGTAQYPEDAAVFLVEHPLKNAHEDFKKLKMPDPYSSGRMPIMIKTTELTRKRLGEGAYIASSVMGPANIASQLLGVNEFMMMFYDDPDFLEQLLDFTSEITVMYGKAMYKAGADCITMGEAICSTKSIGPNKYVNFVKKRHKRVIAEFNKAGIKYHTFHICGQLEPILLDVAETGVASVDVDSPVNMKTSREQLGHKMTMIGNISPAELLNSPKERITELCADVLLGKYGLGLVLGAGCNIAPNTPEVNLRAMVESIKTYGIYE